MGAGPRRLPAPTTDKERHGNRCYRDHVHRGYSEFIASKAPDAASVADEVEAVGADEVTEKGTTVFPRNDDGEPVIWDYQLKGFMKDACGALRRVPGTLSSKCKAYKKVIDGTIFVKERSVAFQLPDGGEVGICERPLRADTPQGARVALARSETVPAGTKIRFTLVVMNKSDWPLVQEWLDYGQFRGIGQWRNSGKGRFEWTDGSEPE